MKKNEKISLSKYLSICGIASRRKSVDLIKQGKVKLNGEIIQEPGYKISMQDEVLCAGKLVSSQEKVYIMLNKPRGYICTNEDPYAPLKAVDLIKLPPEQENIRLFSAGRLDKDSEGLLIFTNDGDYVEKIMHPKHEVLKNYQVKTNSEILDNVLEKLRRGIDDKNEFLKAHKIKKEGNCLYTFILNEGKKREIRRMMRFAGPEIKSLKRISLGSLTLGTLESGKWKYLTPEDIKKTLNKLI
ncbi:MAG: rRNA pseudouridine synthase [Victivallales bacterium]|nr:rRNA pseudouridine synthase [Victivallales bacterium]